MEQLAAIDARYLTRWGEPPRSLRVAANDTELHLLEWGDPAAQPVLLVHGMRGHARWFTPVGPALAERFRVLSLDLRGHGESAHTPPYGPVVYAQDIVALVEAMDLSRLLLLGHSMGGGVVVRAAPSLGARLQGLVIVDSPLGPPPRPAWRPPDDDEPGERRSPVFETWEQARARFKLRPGETVGDPELLDHLARHALYQRPEGGFSFRFDRNVSLRRAPVATPPDGSTIRCPVVSIWGEHSLMLKRVDPREIGERFPSAAWTAAEIIEGAHHHVFIDRPEAFNRVLLKYLDAFCR